MRNLLIMALLFACCITGRAQNIVNGNFAINSGNNGPACGLYNTFADGSVPNWLRSHGTPNFQLSGSSTTDYMMLWTDGYDTEGILGGYEFKKTKQYCINIRLNNWSKNGFFYVVACSNFPRDLTFNPSTCGDAMPALPAGSEIIAIENTMQNDYYYTYNPSVDNNQLFIVSFGDYWHIIAIEEVYIKDGCRDVLIFDNGQIPAGEHKAKHIYAGTSAGSGPNIVTNDLYNNTALRGAQEVVLQHNFLARGTGSASFLARIDPYACFPINCYKIYPKPGHDDNLETREKDNFFRQANSAALTGDTTKFRRLFRDISMKYDNAYSNPGGQPPMPSRMDIRVYPNPSTGNFTLEIPKEGDYELRILNALGTVVYTKKINEVRRYNIQLDDNLPVGNYTLQLTGKDVYHIEKLTVIR